MSRKQTAILSICRSLFVYFGRRVKVARVAIHGKLERWILKGHGLHTATVRLFTAKLNIQQVTPFRADKIQRNPVAERLSFVFFYAKADNNRSATGNFSATLNFRVYLRGAGLHGTLIQWYIIELCWRRTFEYFSYGNFVIVKLFGRATAANKVLFLEKPEKRC